MKKTLKILASFFVAIMIMTSSFFTVFASARVANANVANVSVTNADTSSEEQANTTRVILRGDVSLDKKVNTVDSLLILRHIAGMKVLTDEQLKNGDTNRDKKVNSVDSLLILRLAAGIIPDFGPEDIIPENLEINKTELVLSSGQTEHLIAKVTPEDSTNKQVVWTSDNSEIASVDNNGIVTAKRAGIANINVKTQEGNLNANCVVKIIEENVTIEEGIYNITLANNENSMSVLNGGTTNKTNVLLEKAENKVSQRFKIEKKNNAYIIKPECANNMVVDVYRTNGGALAIGQNIDIYQANDPAAQEWVFTKSYNGNYIIRLNSLKNGAIGAVSEKTSNGDNIILRDYNIDNSEIWWSLTPASTGQPDPDPDPDPIPPPPTEKQGTVINTNGSGLRVRSEPSTTAKQIGFFKEGQKITVIGELTDGWYKVKGVNLNDGKEIIGYSFGEYIKIDDNQGQTLNFGLPVKRDGSTSVTCEFGGYAGHKGIDIASYGGKAVDILAGETGTVIAVSRSCTHNYGKYKSCGCNGGMGNYVKIDHGNGYVSIYMHMSTVNVNPGDKVKKADVIGTMGSTGNSTGYHVHYQIEVNGVAQNPRKFVDIPLIGEKI